MPPDTLRQRLAAAGITPADPLHALIETVAEAAERAAVGPAEVDRIAQQVAQASVIRIEAGLWRRTRLLEARMVAICAALALVVAIAGFGAGWSVRAAQPVPTVAGPLSPRAVAVLRLNDLDAALDRCAPTTQGAGGEACFVGLWVKAPPVAQIGRR